MAVANTVTPFAPKTCNACNTSRNALVEVLSFLESRATGDEWYCPSYLASKSCLDLPGGTVRGMLKKLLADNKVLMDNRGKYHFYASAKRMSDDFNRLLKTHGTAKKWQIHGLTLKISAKDVGLKSFHSVMCNTTPLGGTEVLSSLAPLLREHFGVKDHGLTTFQLSVDTLVVWCGCTLEPMDYDRFVLWLTRVDTWLELHGLTQVRDNLLKWKVVQYGLNEDFIAVDNSKGVSITLKAFDSFIARVYSKPALGENVVRMEAHSREEKSLEAMLGLVSGGMAFAHTQGALGLVASEMQNNNLTQRDTNRIMMRVAQRLDSQEAENQRLRAKLEEQERIHEAERKQHEAESKTQLKLLMALTEKVSRLAN